MFDVNENVESEDQIDEEVLPENFRSQAPKVHVFDIDFTFQGPDDQGCKGTNKAKEESMVCKKLNEFLDPESYYSFFLVVVDFILGIISGEYSILCDHIFQFIQLRC